MASMEKMTDLLFMQVVAKLKEYILVDIIGVIHQYVILLDNQIKYEFYDMERYDKRYETFVNWIGKYTIGNVSCRGTRLWLRPEGAKTLSCNFSGKKELYENLEKAEDSFPGDDCNFRTESLEIILNVLESTENNYDFQYISSLETLLEILVDDYLDDLHDEIQNCDYQITKNDHILIDLFPTGNIWIIHKKNEIIAEIKEILTKCKSKNVTWHWI